MWKAILRNYRSSLEKYTGYKERVWSNAIISTLKGARRYSDYDITGIIQQIKEKKDWLISRYPDEFGPHRWRFDIDECFADNEY